MSKKIISFTGICILLFLLTQPAVLFGQMNNDFFAADQLLQQQEYEEAYKIFKKLFDENPGTYIILEKATECLINLKEYEDAVELVERGISQGYYQAQGHIRMGEIYHISGDTSRAFEIWDRTLETHGENNLQVHLTLARTMENRRAFDRAIELYLTARQNFRDSGMITSELANAYLQSGNHEEAIKEFLQLVKENPDRISYVQNRLIRFQDDYIYDIAILEIEDFLDELPGSHPVRQNLHQLELWLLMERGLHQRAVAKAKNYEERTINVNYMLYSLGARLLADREFELAEEAFAYYVDNNIQPAKYRSMEELANVYIEWASYLEDYNLAFSPKRNTLYQKAFDILEEIKITEPKYQRMSSVLITQSDLALDFLHDPEQARNNLEALKKRGGSSSEAEEHYIEGRLYLYEGDYSRARISLTRSNKVVENSGLKEKTRYYLALTDFYSGDYEFAQVQLKALERQNTSYFANDAIQLRLWIQQGLEIDSTGQQLKPFARSIEQFSLGNHDAAVQSLDEIIRPDSYNPLADEALLQLSSHVTEKLSAATYIAIRQFLDNRGRSSPLHERLMWEQVRIADQILTGMPDNNLKWPELNPDLLAAVRNTTEEKLPESKGELITLYENILIEYSNGFYAPHVRERIAELEKMEPWTSMLNQVN